MTPAQCSRVPLAVVIGWAPNEVLTYAGLASFPIGYDPTLTALAERAHLSRRALCSALSAIEARGELLRWPRPPRRTKYELRFREVIDLGARWVRVPLVLLQDSTLDRAAVLTYIGLASYADSAGKAWPAVATVAQRIGVSPSTVKRSLLPLGQHLRRAPGNNRRSTRYYLLPQPELYVVREVPLGPTRAEQIDASWRRSMLA